MKDVAKRVIYICGADHSGSTLIGCALGAEPEADTPPGVFHIGECHAFFDPANPKFGKVPSARGDETSFWSNVDKSVGPENAYREIFQKSGAPVLVDSSKKLAWAKIQAEACKRDGIGFSVVVTYRPFVDIVDSLLRRDLDLERAMRRIAYYRSCLRFIRHAKPDIVAGVDAALFCRQPAQQLKTLCEAIGIAYFPGKERYWNFKHTYLYGAALQRQHLRNPKKAGYEVRERSPDFDLAKVQQALQEKGLSELEEKLRLATVPKRRRMPKAA